MLDHLREAHAGVERYLLADRMTGADVAALRSRLLE